MPEQVVLMGKGGEIVTPGITMTLRIEDHGVVLVDEAVVIDVVNIVIDRVSHFAFALGEVPEQAVIDRSRFEIVLASEQSEFFFEQGGDLVLKRENGRGLIA